MYNLIVMITVLQSRRGVHRDILLRDYLAVSGSGSERRSNIIATLSEMFHWMLNDTKMRNDDAAAGGRKRNAVDVFPVDGRYRNIN